MRAQRLSVLLAVFVCVHLVYSDNLAQDDHVSEGESSTESVTKMEDTTLSHSEIPTVDITSTTVEMSNPTTTLSPTTIPTTITSTFTTSTTTTSTFTTSTTTTQSSSMHDTIELIQQISSLLLRSTLIMNSTQGLLEELQVFLPKLPIFQRRHQIQTSYITSKQPLSISTTVRAHYRRKMKKKKPSSVVSTKIQKEHRKCKGKTKVIPKQKEQHKYKGESKLMEQISETPKEIIQTVADLPPLNIKMFNEQQYYRTDDPWRYQVYRCWIHRACHFGW